MFTSKSFTFLFFSVALAAAANLQNGGERWGELSFSLRTEAHADVAALRDDARSLQLQIKSAPVVIRTLWSDICYDVKALRADAAAETRVAASRLSYRSVQDR